VFVRRVCVCVCDASVWGGRCGKPGVLVSFVRSIGGQIDGSQQLVFVNDWINHAHWTIEHHTLLPHGPERIQQP